VQRLTFVCLASYLLVGGLGLLVVPELTLRLLLSNGTYGDLATYQLTSQNKAELELKYRVYKVTVPEEPQTLRPHS